MYCYNCGKELPGDATLLCPACEQEIYTFETSSRPSKGRRIDGCLPGGDSANDFRAVPNLGSLPQKVDLRPECPPVEDQGRIGSCVANAVVGAHEFQRRREGQRTDLSRLFVYYNARRMSGREREDCGTTLAKGMAALLAFGAPPEEDWPYDVDAYAKEPSSSVFQRALSNVPGEYARLESMEHLQGALAQRFPVVFGTALPARCYSEADRTGRIPTPTEEELRGPVGRHAMLLVGYDRNDGTYFVRNSWGDSWGEGGYCRMGFETFQRTVLFNSTWILGKLEASGAFTIVRPKLVSKPVDGSVKDKAASFRDEIRSGVSKDIEASIRDIKARFTQPRQGGQGGQGGQ